MTHPPMENNFVSGARRPEAVSNDTRYGNGGWSREVPIKWAILAPYRRITPWKEETSIRVIGEA